MLQAFEINSVLQHNRIARDRAGDSTGIQAAEHHPAVIIIVLELAARIEARLCASVRDVVTVVVWIVASVIFVVFVAARYAAVLERPCLRPFPEPSRRRH
jgi:hypothetical protein